MKELILPAARGQLDEIDKLIAARQLDKHPEMFQKVIDELQLGKFLTNLQISNDLKLVQCMAVNRALNFFEAASLADFTIGEKRIGVAAALLVSCVHVGKISMTAAHRPQNLDTLVPVYLRRLTDYSKIVDYAIPDQERTKVDVIVRLLMTRNPTRASMQSNRTAVFLLDACMAWMTSGNQEVIDFMIGHEHARFKAVGEAADWHIEMGLKDLTLPDTIYLALGQTYASAVYTQWGTARSFTRNTPQAVKALRTKITAL